jgi:hypothetical protein
VPILIHVSLFLFFSGLPVFLSNINRTVFNVVVTWLGLCVAGYACITLMPIFYQNSPYYSPLSSFTWWCVINTLSSIHRLLKNFMPQNSSVFRWYHRSHFRWPSLRAMQEAAENVALHMPQDIDYSALSWMFQTLVVDEEFEQFFDALPSLHDSKALVNAEEKFIKPNEKQLTHALIGMMDRTLLSELVLEDVKQRRIIICTKVVGATSLLGPWWTLHRVLCGDWQEFSGSVHFGLCVQEWKNMSHPVLAFYAQCAVAVTLSTVQKRDNHWFQLASGQLSESKSLLRNYFADDDSILLDDVIFIIRRTMEAFSGSKDRRSDVQEASSKTLELICSFDIRNTLEDLQHHFCSLWNELVDKAEKNSDPDFRSLCIMMLKSTRRLYITLHENTSSSPTAFSTTTDDLNGVLGYASSYPRCINHPSRRVSELKLDELPRNTATAPRDTASLVEVISAFIPVPPPRLSTPPSRVIPSDQTPPFSTVRSPPHPFIPSPNVPIAPLVGPSNPGVSGPHSYPTTLRSSGISQPVSPAAMGGVYSQQDTHSRFAPSESSSTFSSEVPMINIDPPSPPKSPFDTLKGAYLSHGEDVPSAMGEAYSQQDAHVRFAQSESASTSSSESLEIVIESPSPPESLFDISQAAYLSLGEDVPATMGEFYSQQGVHVPVARSLSTSTSSSGSLEIVIVPASPPESLADISPIAIRAEDVPATRGEVYSQDGAHIRFSPSEYTSTSFSESPVIDIVTPSRPESPYGTTIPIPPPPAGSVPSIDASPGPPRTRRSKKVLLISEETAGGGSEPMPSPPLSAGGAKGTPPILKFSGYGDFAGLLYHSPHSVMYEEDLYPTALHLFEAHKFLYHRPDLAERIRQCERVEDVTAMSEELGEFVRRDWGNVALSTVSNLFFLNSTCISLGACVGLTYANCGGGRLDGRCVIPQVPAARRPARVASQYLPRRSRVCRVGRRILGRRCGRWHE